MHLPEMIEFDCKLINERAFFLPVYEKCVSTLSSNILYNIERTDTATLSLTNRLISETYKNYNILIKGIY